jgi:hypothetical protein
MAVRSTIYVVQTGSGAHLASYEMGISPEVTRPGSESDHSPPATADWEIVDLYIHTPSWPSAQLVTHKETLLFSSLRYFRI